MDLDQLKKDLKHLERFRLPEGRVLNDPELDAAIRLAGYELAHYLDVPELNWSDSVTVSANTPNYNVNAGEKLDRITVATFQTSTKKTSLRETDIRSYDGYYRGEGKSGFPVMFCFYQDQVWLYKIPDTNGTLYLRGQLIIEDVAHLRDNYYPLIYQLTKRNLYDENTSEWFTHDKIAMRLIRSFKGRVRPYKSQFEPSIYRLQRTSKLSQEY